MPPRNDNQLKGRVLVAGATVSLGSMAIFGKLAYAAGANTVTTLAFRFVLTATFLWLTVLASRPGPLGCRSNRGRVPGDAPSREPGPESPTGYDGGGRLPSGRDAAFLILAGIGGYGVVAGSYFLSLKYLPASLTSFLFFTYPVYLAIITALWERDTVSIRHLLALLLSITGVALVLGPRWREVSLPGVGWALTGAVIHALYVTVTNRVVRRIPPLICTAYLSTGAALAYLAVGLATASLSIHLRPAAAGSIAAMGLINGLFALRALWSGIRLIGPNNAALITTMEPLVTSALAVMILGESWGLRQTIGAALILAGVWWVPQTRAPKDSAASGQEIGQ